MAQIIRITSEDPLYEQELDLRRRVLLEPIGLSLERYLAEYRDAEEQAEHFVGVIDHPKGPRVVVCGCLVPNYPEEGVGKLTQMAVDPQRQHEGLGRRLVAEIERRAFGELRLKGLFCHAQVAAQGFYEKMGWVPEGEEFVEAGLQHRKMVFQT